MKTSISPWLFSIVFEVLTGTMRKEKKLKWIQTGEKRSILLGVQMVCRSILKIWCSMTVENCWHEINPRRHVLWSETRPKGQGSKKCPTQIRESISNQKWGENNNSSFLKWAQSLLCMSTITSFSDPCDVHGCAGHEKWWPKWGQRDAYLIKRQSSLGLDKGVCKFWEHTDHRLLSTQDHWKFFISYEILCLFIESCVELKRC